MTPRSDAPSRRRIVLLVLLTLLGLVVVGRLALAAFLDRPAPSRLPEVGATTAEARPFCLIVLDGLREPSAWAVEDPPMPWLQAFARLGAWGVAWAGDPTLTAPCVRAILTGRAPDLVTSFKNFDADPVSGSVIEYLHDRGARTAHAGDASIYQFCRPYYDPALSLAIPDQGPTDLESDQLAVRFLLDRIEEGADVVTLHLTRPDHTGHMSGATGPAYHDACRIVDGQVQRVVEAFLDRQPKGLVLVAADHGVSPTGTHGGGETSARRAPFALVGPGVARVGPVEISQFSLAPTVAGLLGLPMPPLADAPPAAELLDLPEERVLHVLDAYLQARLVIARSLGVQAVDPIERKRAEVAVDRLVGGTGDAYRELSDEVGRLLNPSSAGDTMGLLAVALLWFITVVHLASVERASPIGTLVATAVTAGGLAPALLFDTPLAAGGVLAVACVAVWVLAARERPRGAVFTTACLVTVPVLTAAGLAFTAAMEATEEAGVLETRVGVFLIGLALLLVLLFRPRRLYARLAAQADVAPGLIGAFGGVALGFTLTLRPFVDPLIDLRIVFACVGLAVAGWMVFGRGARTRPVGERVFLALVAIVLFVAPRVADLRLEQSWLEVVARRDPTWLLAGLGLVGVVAAVAGRRGIRREDLPGIGLALVALAGAYTVRLDDAPTAWLSRGTNLVGTAALLLTLFRGSLDGRLLVRLLAALALARRLTVLDGEFAAFALFALGAALAARFPAPSSRARLAWLAVGVLAIRQAVHHAMGGTESFSTVDVAAGFVGLEAAPAAAADGGGITWPIVEATLQLVYRFSLPWVVMLAAASRALPSPADVRALIGDLVTAFTARGASIAFALWAWWRSAWWVDQARAVFALGAMDLILLVIGALLAGAFLRGRPRERAA